MDGGNLPQSWRSTQTREPRDWTLETCETIDVSRRGLRLLIGSVEEKTP